MRRVTIRDVAKQAGVSITTVSKALNNYPDVNEQTKKRIEEIVQSMNYVPDAAGRSMGGISEQVVGLLINDLKPEDPSGAVYSILSGVCRACRDNKMEFLLMTTDVELQEQVPLKRLILSKNLSGLIFSGFREEQPYICQMRELGIPCACIDFETGDEEVTDITIDNLHAAEEAVSFLIQNKRSRIAVLHGNDQTYVSNCRKEGYCRALERAGLPLMPSRMLNGDFDRELAYEKTRALLERDREIDAIFCCSDLMAFGACRAVEEAGLTVGRDVAVVGFDDIPSAQYLYGGLTTVRQNFYNMGYTAGMETVRRILDRPGDGGGRMLPYELVIRATAPVEA